VSASSGRADRLNGRQRLIVGLLLAILVIDGIDVGLLSVAAPPIIAEWHASKASFGFALSAAIAGMAAGSITGGWLGDRIGRKTVMIGSLVLFGSTTMLTATAGGVAILTILRFVSGIGFGAANPTAMALAAEWLPAARRSRIGSLMAMGAPLGVMLASYLGLLALSALGWRGTFVGFGILTLVVGAGSALVVPESAAYLRGRGRQAKAEALERKVLGAAVSSPRDEEVGDRPVAESSLASPDMRRFNLGAWLAFFASSYVTYTLASWLPVLLQGIGFPYPAAVRGLFFMTAMALVGTVVAGRLMFLLGSRPVTIAIAAAMLLFSLVFYLLVRHGGAQSPVLIYSLCAGLGLTQGSIAGALYGLVSVRYPTAIRASGIGIAMMMAKVGGVVAILIGGRLLDGGTNPQAHIVASFGVAALLLAASVCIVDRHLPPHRKSLEIP
jgi:AAHS family 4-hydroxybenzoate transporter-like MFS transporter